MKFWPPDHYGTHAFIGRRRYYLLVSREPLGIQLILHGKRIFQLGFHHS